MWTILLLVMLLPFGQAFGEDARPQCDREADTSTAFTVREFDPSKEPVTPQERAWISINSRYDLSAYLAAAAGDLSLGQFGGSRERAERLLAMKKIAEGRCGDAQQDVKSEACWVFLRNDCPSLTDPIPKAVCEAVVASDVQTIDENVRRVAVDGTSRFDVLRFVALVKGYRGDGRPSCQQTLESFPSDVGPVEKFFFCRLFFSEDPNTEFLVMKDELTLFELGQADRSSCEKINDAGLKRACEDTAKSH